MCTVIPRSYFVGRDGVPVCSATTIDSRDISSWRWLVPRGDLDRKEIQPVHSKGGQPWVFFGRNDPKAETPVLWPPHEKSWLIGKDSDAGKDWGQEEEGTTEDEMAGWHHRLDGREFKWTPGDGDGQGGLACCDSWGRKESDMTERLNWTERWFRLESGLLIHVPKFPVLCGMCCFFLKVLGESAYQPETPHKRLDSPLCQDFPLENMVPDWTCITHFCVLLQTSNFLFH